MTWFKHVKIKMQEIQKGVLVFLYSLMFVGCFYISRFNSPWPWAAFDGAAALDHWTTSMCTGSPSEPCRKTPLDLDFVDVPFWIVKLQICISYLCFS